MPQLQLSTGEEHRGGVVDVLGNAKSSPEQEEEREDHKCGEDIGRGSFWEIHD